MGVLAVDRLIDLGGELASISEDVRKNLTKILPERWSNANPVDILGDADSERYAQACEYILGDTANNALLIMNAPNTLASPIENAKSVANAVLKHRKETYSRKPVFTAWIGDDGEAANIFGTAGIPHFSSEADAVRGFMHIVRYREGLDVAMQTPPSLPEDFAPDVVAGRAIVRQALKDDRTWLNPIEITDLFAAYACRSRPRLAYNRLGFAGEIARFAWTTTGSPVVSGFQVVPPSTDLNTPPLVPAHTEFSHGP